MSRPPSQQYASTTPLNHPPWTPLPVGQAGQVLLSSRTPKQQPLVASPASPSYFGFVVDSSNAVPNSSETPRLKQRVGQSPSSIRSHAAVSPKVISADAKSDYEAFRRRSERGSSFVLNGDGLFAAENGSLMQRGTSANNSARPSLQSPRDIGSRPSPFLSNPNSFTQNPSQVESPGTLASPQSHPQLLLAEDRNSRLSLPTSTLANPSDSSFLRSHNQRSSTLPIAIENDAELFLTAQHLSELLHGGHQFLLLDLRTSSSFAKSRICNSVHVCLSKVLLKRQSYTADKVADGIQDPSQRARFKTWRLTPLTLVYDDRASTIQEAASLTTMLNKFPKTERQGAALILKGGFDDFSRRFPELIDQSTPEGTGSSAQHLNLDLSWNGAAVATGCLMPSSYQCTNPLFSNLIRQNQDLRDGVGQIPLKFPSKLDNSGRARLPKWLQTAAATPDEGKLVADRFLRIEKAEQQRMEMALSMQVTKTPGNGTENVWRIAGMEKGGKNRYNKIWPFEHSRVRLQNVPSGQCDYFNANHIKSPLGKHRYIATQGPLPSTFNDFWRVVWEQDVRVIVMLTAESEGGQIKCHQYWQTGHFGNMKLRLLSEHRIPLEKGKASVRSPKPLSSKKSGGSGSSSSDGPYILTRKFALCNSHEPFTPVREVTQLAYTFWPDFGIPTHPSHLLGLVNQCNGVVRAAAATSPSAAEVINNRPILVHCSAGCGRTGAFCTVDTVTEMMSRKLEAQWGRATYEDWMSYDDVDLIELTVKSFREQRISMVQNLGQYVLAYQSALEWFAGVIT
ncbi:MAG: hypothetical protein M1814_002111 [Vezdaea aestivalis]|nr:MAG: hypothetical protein M1814_002111 [Vezdaea aestivalis]